MDPDSILIFAAGFAAAFFLCLIVGYLLYRFYLGARRTITEEEVKQMVQDAGENDVIDAEQSEMIDNILELSDVTAIQIMTHRTEIAAVEMNDSISHAMELSLEEGFSRLPVYSKTLDNIVGILYIKDMLSDFAHSKDSIDRPIHEVMRQPIFVPESCKARQLLIELREKHTHVAIVVDEYGGTSGLVTMEDILEQIVGNIWDEYDSEEEAFQRVDGGVVCDGGVELEELFEFLEKEVPENDEEKDEDYDTVSGFIIAKIGHIPAKDEQVILEHGGISFAVKEVSERRIEKVFCFVLEGLEDGEED